MAIIGTHENLFNQILEKFSNSIQKKEYLVYGILVYTLDNLNITQIINDKDQWVAIDSTTGKNALICYVDLSDYVASGYSERCSKMRDFAALPIDDYQIYCSDLKELMNELIPDKYNLPDLPFIIFFLINDSTGDIEETYILNLKNKNVDYIINRFNNLNEKLSMIDRAKGYDKNTLFALAKDGLEPDLFAKTGEMRKVMLLSILKAGSKIILNA